MGVSLIAMGTSSSPFAADRSSRRLPGGLGTSELCYGNRAAAREVEFWLSGSLDPAHALTLAHLLGANPVQAARLLGGEATLARLAATSASPSTPATDDRGTTPAAAEQASAVQTRGYADAVQELVAASRQITTAQLAAMQTGTVSHTPGAQTLQQLGRTLDTMAAQPLSQRARDLLSAYAMGSRSVERDGRLAAALRAMGIDARAPDAQQQLLTKIAYPGPAQLRRDLVNGMTAQLATLLRDVRSLADLERVVARQDVVSMSGVNPAPGQTEIERTTNRYFSPGLPDRTRSTLSQLLATHDQWTRFLDAPTLPPGQAQARADLLQRMLGSEQQDAFTGDELRAKAGALTSTASSTATADSLPAAQDREHRAAQSLLTQAMTLRGVAPGLQREVLRQLASAPTDFSTVRPWLISEAPLADIVSQSARGNSLILYTRREAAELASLREQAGRRGLTLVEVSDRDTNTLAAVRDLLARPDIGQVDRVIAVGGAGVKDLATTLIAVGRGSPAQVMSRIVGQDRAALDEISSLAQNLLRPAIDYVSVPTVLATTAPGTPFAVLKEGSTVIIDQRPAATVVPLARLREMPAQRLQQLTMSGLTDYLAGLSYAAGVAHRDGLPLAQAIERHAPVAWNLFQWFETHRGPVGDEAIAVQAYALREYAGNHRPLVAGEHDLWDAMVALRSASQTQLSHGQVVAVGSVLQAYLYGVLHNDFSLYDRMRDLYSDLGAPIDGGALQRAGMTRELMRRAIEFQVGQPTGRPSLYHAYFTQFTDPELRRAAIEQVLDRALLSPARP